MPLGRLSRFPTSGPSRAIPGVRGWPRTILLGGGASPAGPSRERSARGHLRAARTKTRGRGRAASILMRGWGGGGGGRWCRCLGHRRDSLGKARGARPRARRRPCLDAGPAAEPTRVRAVRGAGLAFPPALPREEPSGEGRGGGPVPPHHRPR